MKKQLRSAWVLLPFIVLLAWQPAPAQTYQASGQGQSGPAVLQRTTDPDLQRQETGLPQRLEALRFEVPAAVLDSLKRLSPQAGGRQPVLEQDPSVDDPVPAAPRQLIDFNGIEFTGTIPASPSIAVGPGFIVVTVNRSFAIYDRTGRQVFQSTLESWFSHVTPPGLPFSPKVIYDHYAGRFIILALARSANRSSYLISVSDDNNPNGLWLSWNLDAAMDSDTPTNNAADSPHIGYDGGHTIYITSNQYDNFLAGAFEYAKIRLLNKAELYANQEGRLLYQDFTGMRNSDNSLAFGLVPVQTYDGNEDGVLLSTKSTGGDSLTIWRVSTPTTNATLLREATLAVARYAPPPNASQPGGSSGADLISTGDCRLQNAVLRDGFLYTTFTESRRWSNAPFAALRYFKIDLASRRIAIDNTYGADGLHYYYPAIGVDGNEDIYLVFNRSGSSEYAGIRFTGRQRSDQAVQGSASLRAGRGFYRRLDGANRNRWGDYSGLVADPARPGTFWIYGAFAESNNTWGTGAGLISFRGQLRPGNDECGNATEVDSLPFTDNVDTRLATPNANDPQLACGSDNPGNTVWYRFTPARSGTYAVHTFGSNFDTVLGLFTGTCGRLVEIGCNDDTGGLQSRIIWTAEANVTYYILATEYSNQPTGGDLTLTVEETDPPQLFQGPAQGQIAGGARVSTDDFQFAARERLRPPPVRKQMPNMEARFRKAPDAPKMAPRAPMGSNEIDDPAVQPAAAAAPLLLRDFPGIVDVGARIPPDPHMAAGPNHLMATVNSQFAIYDKAGNQLKLIDADRWYASVHPGGNPFDPQIVYDHHARRWIMIWIDFQQSPPRSDLLLSISDDENPLGVWCNWRLPGNQNGSEPNTLLNDYPKLGLDADAIYVSANMFDIAASFAYYYVQLRVIPKAQLLANDCGPLAWSDFWDLRVPVAMNEPAFTTVPAVTFGTPGTQYFVDVDIIQTTGTFANLWALRNPLSAAPELSAISIPITAFRSPPQAAQLGGGFPLLDVGGRRVRNAVYQNGSLWTAHSVADASERFARARYLRIDVNSARATEDVSYGADDFYYYYPAVHPDSSDNLVLGFTRSGTNEYAGAFFTGRRTSDPPGLGESMLLKAGEANYVKTFGGDRNRWGDYLGIAQDPTDRSNIWMFLQYAAPPEGTGANSARWGTWFGLTSYDAAPPACRVRARVDAPPVLSLSDTIAVRICINMTGCRTDSLLGSFNAQVRWDANQLRYVSSGGLQAGFTGVVNDGEADSGLLVFNGVNSAGAGGDVCVLTTTFVVTGTPGTSGQINIGFSEMAAARTFTDLLPFLTTEPAPFRIQEQCRLCGDVNGDGVVNSTDALIVLTYDAGLDVPPPFLEIIGNGCGDVNRDGLTNSTDALIILSYDAGMNVPFPVGRPGGCGGSP